MDTLTLSVVGAAYGTSLAVVLSRRAWRDRSRADGMLALALTSGLVAIAAILLSHRTVDPAALWLERIEIAATLSSGPAIFLWLKLIGGVQLRRRDALHGVASASALVLPSWGGAPMLGVPMALIVAHQMSYTVAASTVWMRKRDSFRRTDRVGSALLLGIMMLIHAGQLVRLSAGGSRDLIPVLFGTAAMLGCGGAAAIVVLRAKRTFARASRTEPGDADRDAADRLQALMLTERLYRRTTLTLPDLAIAAGAAPHEMTRLLNDVVGKTFHEYLAELRVADACERLVDPANDVITIDALAEASGFRSRSSFYTSFRKIHGCSPTEYRSRVRGERS